MVWLDLIRQNIRDAKSGRRPLAPCDSPDAPPRLSPAGSHDSRTTSQSCLDSDMSLSEDLTPVSASSPLPFAEPLPPASIATARSFFEPLGVSRTAAGADIGGMPHFDALDLGPVDRLRPRETCAPVGDKSAKKTCVPVGEDRTKPKTLKKRRLVRKRVNKDKA